MAILVVQDDVEFSDVVAFVLRRSGHTVLTASSGEAALQLCREHRPELVILDTELPGVSGWELFGLIRTESRIPIVFLSDRHDDAEVARGLEMGADDYITSPFAPAVLTARVNRLLRRGGHGEDRAVETSPDLKLESDGQVSYDHHVAQLTRTEYRILAHLKNNMGRAVPHDELVRGVWGYFEENSSKLIKVHAYNLRQKLARIGYGGTIAAISGVGYVLRMYSGEEARPAVA
jgi:two-component system, OmpR family, response regulator